MGLIASRNSDGLSDGWKPNFLQDLNRLISRVLFEHSETNLFLHDVDPNLRVCLRKPLSKRLLDLGSAIGAADTADLDGENTGTSALMNI